MGCHACCPEPRFPVNPHLYPLLKNGVLLHPQEPGTPGRIERFPSEPSGHWVSGRAMGLLSALSVGPRGLARDREEAEGLPRPRPLPILGQVWADFKDSNFKSVQSFRASYCPLKALMRPQPKLSS